MNVNPVRGMKDLYGLEFRKYQFIVDTACRIAESYGYQVMETPIVEKLSVFQRSLGDESDVVSKEMYSFDDKGGETLVLRPEGTAGVMRAIASNNIFVNDNNALKVMYYGPMFRYDRPQKGRYRQFHQIGFEHIGEKSPYTDALTIALAMDVLHALGLKDVFVSINSLGSFESRKKYLRVLVEYLKKFENDLSRDSQRRLLSNPLRILDSKEESDINICKNAPKILDYLSENDGIYYKKVLQLLDSLNVNYKVDQNLVRGLDYYTHTTFEFKIQNNEYQDALGGGGRYDGLLNLFCKNDTSGVGFALGIERIMLFLSEKKVLDKKLKVAVIPVSQLEFDKAFELTRELIMNNVTTEFINAGNSLKKRVELATKRNCNLLCIIGADELKNQTVTVTKVDCNEQGKNQIINRSEVVTFVKNFMTQC